MRLRDAVELTIYVHRGEFVADISGQEEAPLSPGRGARPVGASGFKFTGTN